MVASIVRTIFAQPDREHVNSQFDEVTRMLHRSHPKVAEMFDDGRPDILAFADFPQRHWTKIWSTNPLERVNKESKRRTVPRREHRPGAQSSVSFPTPQHYWVFPNPAALLRLAGAVLIEQHDEWNAGERRYLAAASMLELTVTTPPTEEVIAIPEIVDA